MKQVTTILIALMASLVCRGQDSYSGKFTITAPNSSNGNIYINSLAITITNSTEASITFHFRGGSRTEPDDYVDLSGSITGSFENGQLEASGMADVEMKDGSRFDKASRSVSFKGSLNAGKLEGKVYMSPVTSQEFLAFSASAGELKPVLTFPVGASPKVFNKGWTFGASFVITNEDGTETDLSDKVEWSGTATFDPSTGKLSHPVFNTIGSNKIILTVNYEGKKYKGEYNVVTVDAKDFAHVGTLAQAPSHGHGCVACPHGVIGPVIEGSPDVLINGFPAARVGDAGVAAACCGPNTFVITHGEFDVLINGRRAAKKVGAYTLHCGVGQGQTVGDRECTEANNDVTVNGNGFNSGGNTNFSKDDEIKTGDKGQLTFSNGNQTVVTVMPSTALKVLDNTKEQITLLIKYGAMMVSGNTSTGKKILLDLKKLSVSPKGTRFFIKTDSLETNIYVFHGGVMVTDKLTGKTSGVDSGFYYHEINNTAEILPLTDNGEKRMREAISHVDTKSMQITLKEPAVAEEKDASPATAPGNDLKKFLKDNIFYIAAGALALILIIMLLVRKRKKA